jgi:hypothetical protein
MSSTKAHPSRSTSPLARRSLLARLLGLALLLVSLATAARAAAPLAISPSSTTVPAGGHASFSATGGAGGYHFALSTDASGGQVDATTGAYTAGGTAGVDVVAVTDAAGATKTASVKVQASNTVTPNLGGPRL